MNCYLKKPCKGLPVVYWYQFYNLCLERGCGNEQSLKFGSSLSWSVITEGGDFCEQNSPGELQSTKN